MNGTRSSGSALRTILERRSSRRFRQEPISDDVLADLLEAARWAPSADNGQPWYIVVIRDEATRQRLNAVAQESRRLYDLWSAALPEHGRLAALPDFVQVPLCLAIFADPRQSPAYVEGEQSHVLAAGLAIQNLWLAAQALGLGACLWSHLEQDQMKSILGLPHHFYFAGVLGLGFPDPEEDRSPRARKPLAEIVGYEWFKTPRGEPVPADKLDLLREFLPY